MFSISITCQLLNNCNDILRYKQNCISTNEEIVKEYIEKDYELCEWKEMMDSLDEKYRVIVLLYYSQGLKVREISKLLKLNKNTVLTRLARAKEQLKKEYSHELNSPSQWRDGLFACMIKCVV